MLSARCTAVNAMSGLMDKEGHAESLKFICHACKHRNQTQMLHWATTALYISSAIFIAMCLCLTPPSSSNCFWSPPHHVNYCSETDQYLYGRNINAAVQLKISALGFHDYDETCQPQDVCNEKGGVSVWSLKLGWQLMLGNLQVTLLRPATNLMFSLISYLTLLVVLCSYIISFNWFKWVCDKL